MYGAGNDLVIHLNAGESITFDGWYLNINARSVGVLQVLTEDGDYAPGSAGAISDHQNRHPCEGGGATTRDR